MAHGYRQGMGSSKRSFREGAQVEKRTHKKDMGCTVLLHGDLD